MDRNENLVGLENILTEFFSHLTSNQRKREIEKVLESFSQQETAWRDSLFFLSNSTNQYVAMFSLTTIEQVIQKRWLGLVPEHKSEIRTELNSFLVKNMASAPTFIRNKVMKLIVDIAKSDWPHFYPDFFPQMLQLIHGQETTAAGLSMLLIACEELATPREDISSSRAAELRRMMNQQVSHIALALTNILESILDRDVGGSGVNTPPPSPSLSGESSEDSSSGSMEGGGTGGGAPLTSHSILNFGLTRPGSKQPSPALSLILDPETAVIPSLCLKIFSQIFTWSHLPSAVNSRVINVLFMYASLTVKKKTFDQTISDISVLAMVAVNEIMAKNYVPVQFQDYLLSLYRGTFNILQGLLQGCEPVGPSDVPVPLHSADPSYLEKITEFLRTFVSAGHLRRCEDNDQFPLLEFLGLIFKFTFQQSTAAGLHACLDIWTALIDYVQGSLETHRDMAGGGSAALISKYQEALLSLVLELLRKCQFRCNSKQLQEIDTEPAINSDSETEWQQFLVSVIETIMRVAELLPTDVLRVTDSVWREACVLYLGLEQHVEALAGGTRFHLSSQEEDNLKLHYTLRDFCSLLLLSGRLSALFLGAEEFPARLPAGLDYVKQLLALAAFGSRTKLYACQVSSPQIQADFVEVHAQTLAALKAWCHWLASLHSESLSDSSYTWLCSDLTSRIVSAVVSVVKEGGNERLVHAATHFLVTLTGTVRPPSIWKLKEYTDLYSSINHLRLKPDSHRLLVRSLCNVLLLSWPGIQEQKWEDRRKHLTKFLRDLTTNFRSLKTSPGFATSKELQQQAEPVIVHTLQMLGDLVDNVINEVTQTKKLCYDTIRDYIDISLWLFPLYIQSAQVCEEMFNFFHVVFDVLRSQMGSAYVEDAVQTFLSLFGENQLAQAIVQGGTTGAKVVEKFLSILTFIVSEPGPTFRKFVPSTLSLCLDHIFPLVAEQPVSDIRSPMYSLLYNTLVNNWQFFFRSNLMASLGKVDNSQPEMVENREVFLQALKAIGQSFLQPDIAVFRQNIEALENLNRKWKLYSKVVFRETLLAEFLAVFLQVLIAKSHNLLREEIGLALYNMAATDFSAFFDAFLPGFLASLGGGGGGSTAGGQLDERQATSLAAGWRRQDTDLPSFAANLDRFVTDLRFYQIVNSSLPGGTVKF